MKIIKLIKTGWETLSWWFFMKKIELALWFAYKQKNRRIRKYCKHGRHRISNDYIKVTQSGYGFKREKVLIDVSYFKCLDCETLFFVTQKDKEKYAKYQADEKENWKLLFDRMNNKGVVKSTKAISNPNGSTTVDCNIGIKLPTKKK
jgi:hypothetical protein